MNDNAAIVQAVYDRQAVTFDQRRDRSLFEAGWLEAFVEGLPLHPHVLDVGCGTGEPIARWLLGRNITVTGIDFSPRMLSIAKDRWPRGDWRIADMRNLNLGETFDGIIGWNSLFHLTEDEQRECLPRLVKHLVPGGMLLLTVGHLAGETTGQVGSETVFHASLSQAEYAELLKQNHMELIKFSAQDNNTRGHTVVLACKTQEDTP